MLELWVIENIQVVAQLFKIDVWNKHTQKNEHVYFGGENEKNILSCVDFTRLFNFISRFPEISIDILKNYVTFTL